MGAKTQILLVIALLVGYAQAAERVDACQHSAFWLWSGVKASDELRNAQTVYLHQGEVFKQAGEVVFQRLGLPVSRLTFPSIWLTVRFTTLDVPPTIVPRIVRLMQRWQTAGNQVVGLQMILTPALISSPITPAFYANCANSCRPNSRWG